MRELELRSFCSLSRSVNEVRSYFHPVVEREEIKPYLASFRFHRARLQQKRVRRRQNRTFSIIPCYLVESLEMEAVHQKRRLWKCLGRALAANPNVRKSVFTLDQYIQITVWYQDLCTTCVCLEAEHPDCAKINFLYEHPTGQTYRKLVLNFGDHFLVDLLEPKAVTGGGWDLTQPVNPDAHFLSGPVPDGLMFAPKLDGRPVTGRVDKGHLVYALETRSFPTEYRVLGQMTFRMEYRPESFAVIVDCYRGSNSDSVASLPFAYRHSILEQLEGAAVFPAEIGFQEFTTSISRTPSLTADGFLAFDLYALHPPLKFKYEYTVDLSCVGQRLYSSDNMEFSTARRFPLESGRIYECELQQDGVAPLRTRDDKKVANHSLEVSSCFLLNTLYRHLVRKWFRAVDKPTSSTPRKQPEMGRYTPTSPDVSD